MARKNKFYERVGGGQIKLWQVTKEYVKSNLNDQVGYFTDLFYLDVEEKEIAIQGSRIYKSVANFNDRMKKRAEEAQRVIDYWNHNTGTEIFDVIEEDWVSPATVYGACGSTGSGVPERAIDENVIVFDLHDKYPPSLIKKVSY